MDEASHSRASAAPERLGGTADVMRLAGKLMSLLPEYLWQFIVKRDCCPVTCCPKRAIVLALTTTKLATSNITHYAIFAQLLVGHRCCGSRRPAKRRSQIPTKLRRDDLQKIESTVAPGVKVDGQMRGSDGHTMCPVGNNLVGKVCSCAN